MEESLSSAPRGAGQYAAERHQRGLRSFRRRFYRQVGVALVFVFVAELLLALYMNSFLSWIMFSFIAGAW